MRFRCYVLGTKFGGVLLLRMRLKKLESFSFIQFEEGFRRDIRYFFGVPLLRFGHEIRWCFAAADASQSHAACAWQARGLQDVANMRKKLKKLKSFSFSRVSEGALGTFLGFLWYVLGTKLDSVLLLQMRHKATHSLCLAGSLAARCGKHA